MLNSTSRIFLLLLVLTATGLYAEVKAQKRWDDIKKVYIFGADTVFTTNANGKLVSSYLKYSEKEKIVEFIRLLDENDEGFRHIQGVYLNDNVAYIAYLYDKRIEYYGYPDAQFDSTNRYKLVMFECRIFNNSELENLDELKSYGKRREVLDVATQLDKKYTFSTDRRSKHYDLIREKYSAYRAKGDLVCLPPYRGVDLYVEKNTAYVFTMCGNTLREYHIDLNSAGPKKFVEHRSYITPKLKQAYNQLNVFYKFGLLYVQFGEKLYLLDRDKDEEYWLLLDKKARFPMTIEISGPFAEQTLLR